MFYLVLVKSLKRIENYRCFSPSTDCFNVFKQQILLVLVRESLGSMKRSGLMAHFFD